MGRRSKRQPAKIIQPKRKKSRRLKHREIQRRTGTEPAKRGNGGPSRIRTYDQTIMSRLL